VDVRNDEVDSGWQMLVKPTTVMSLEALATHHIPEAQALKNGLEWDNAMERLLWFPPDVRSKDDLIFCAHNAVFEQAFFNPDGFEWIDTYKVALRLWPESPSHSNQVLRYFLGLELGDEAMPPHRAWPDCYVTAHILLIAMDNASVSDMVQWTKEPPYLTKLTFGKHKGQRFEDVPVDYLQWILRQDMDEGVKAAAQRVLSR